MSENGPFTYPDVSVSCDDRDRTAQQFMQFPCLIVEVLSPGTEAYDRGGKFAVYRRLESLQEWGLPFVPFGCLVNCSPRTLSASFSRIISPSRCPFTPSIGEGDLSRQKCAVLSTISQINSSLIRGSQTMAFRSRPNAT